jgi:hypothetical protein
MQPNHTNYGFDAADSQPPNNADKGKTEKDSLLNRLYDQGFSHWTMPSVTRPAGRNSHARPMNCKLYALGNELTREVKQPQHSILFNVEEQNYLSNVEEKDLVQRKISMGLTSATGFYNTKSGFTKKARDPDERMMENFSKDDFTKAGLSRIQTGQPGQTVTKQFGFDTKSSMASMFPTSKPRLQTGQTAAMAQTYQEGLVKTQNNFYSGDDQKPQFPSDIKNAILTTGNFFSDGTLKNEISEKEFAQSKFIINKLRGVYTNPKDDIIIEEGALKGSPKRGEDAGPTLHEQKMELVQQSKIRAANQGQVAQVTYQQGYKRQPTELDLYIDLILKSNSNVDEFIYLVPNKGSDDPYDLLLVDYNELEGKTKKYRKSKGQNDLKEYYTISMKGLCHYKNGKPVEFIGLSYWLKERETYDQIKSLEFFTKFRRWKTLKMWRKSCKSFKRNSAKKDLEEKLFFTYDDLRNALFKHRELCFDMSQYKFID